MPTRDPLPYKLARHYNLPLQVSSFLALLIVSESITAEHAFQSLGQVEAKSLAHRLRAAMKSQGDKAIEIHSRRSVGYWLDDETRRSLAAKFGVTLGISL